VLETLRILGAAAVVVAAATGLGRVLWRWRAPSYSIAYVSGSAALSAIMFGLLVLGYYRPWAICAVLLASISAGAWRLGAPQWTRPPWWASTIALLYAGLYLVHALAPEIQPDAAGYHLGIPSQWLATGGFTGRIGFFELLPLGIETLYGAAIALGGASAAKLVHFSFLLFGAALMLQIARRLDIGPAAAWAAALLLALSPVTGISSTSAYTDDAMVCAQLALLALLLDWKDAPSATHALHAGAAAGLCYSIKMSGAIAVVVLFGYLVWRRRTAHALASAAAAAVVALPWAMKAWWLTSNPLAPLGNAWFENDAFHASTEQVLAGYLRSYTLSSWTDIPRQLLFSGESLQGLFGPVFILAPLALLALRKKAGRWLLATAVVAAVPWTMNIGARFLMPPMAFVALALASALPARMLPALLAIHAALSLPVAMDHYAGTHAWRLKGWPWQAAFRVLPEAEYLRANYFEYNVARMVASHVKKNEGVVDLVGVPLLYSNTPAQGPLPTVVFDQMAGAMTTASLPLADRLFESRFTNHGGFLRGVKVRFRGSVAAHASIADLRLEWAGQKLPVSRYWFLSAWPAPQDAALAVDGNLSTYWRSLPPASDGSYLVALFDRPVPFDSLRLVSAAVGGAVTPLEVYGLNMDRAWRRLAPAGEATALPVRALRAEASALVRSRGFRWIVAPTSVSGYGPVGRSLRDYPHAWSVDRVGEVEGICLFRIH